MTVPNPERKDPGEGNQPPREAGRPESVSSSKSGPADRRQRAEDILSVHLSQLEAKEAMDIDALCAEHPGLADQLRSVLEDWKLDVGEGINPTTPVDRSAGEPHPDPIGRRLSHYEISERLGAGGMGEVYRARDLRLDREVALKVLPPQFLEDRERKTRFLREARLASRLSHPNIATIYEADEVEGTLFFTMELVRGETLDARIRPGGLPLKELLDLATPLAEGLAEAHHAGIVHRDLKPTNVMVDERGRVKILDFGLSRLSPGTDETVTKLTASDQVIGTPYYMSPEQVRGEKIDTRTDLFSLGVILYELATGVRPFLGDTHGQVMDAVIREQPPPVQRSNPHLPDELARIMERLLQKDPAQRVQTADDLVAELRLLRQMSGANPSRRKLFVGAVVTGFVALAMAFLIPPLPGQVRASGGNEEAGRAAFRKPG